MKGGGFLVLLFLLFCFLWGISAIVGGLREAVRSWFAKPNVPEPDSRPVHRPQEHVIQDVIALPPRAQHNPTKPLETSNPVTELRNLYELHQLGALSKDEFEAMKQRLLESHLSTRSNHVQ